jgi:hypothetical protein
MDARVKPAHDAESVARSVAHASFNPYASELPVAP